MKYATGVTLLAVGGLLIYSGFTDVALWDTVLQAVRTGNVSGIKNRPTTQQALTEVNAQKWDGTTVKTLPGLGPVAPNVAACANAIAATFGNGFGGMGGVGPRPDNPTSDHPSGKALDVMTSATRGSNQCPAAPNEKGRGDSIARWVISQRSQFNVKYVIWHGQIANAGTGWVLKDSTKMSGGRHCNHVHISFF